MAFGLLSGTSGVQPGFLARLEALRRALPNNLGAQIGVRSAYRSPEHQAELFRRAVQKYGSEAAARHWVAPPGHSQHNRGNAIDLSYGSPEAMRAAHQYASQFGLVFPMSYEDWHIEPIGARGGKSLPLSAAAGSGPAGAPAAGPGVADLLAGAAGNSGGGGVSGFNAGGGAGSRGGIVGDPSPIAIPDLRTPGPEVAPPQAAPPPLAQDPSSQLAGLFSLPTIGPSLPDPNTMPALPGQAKPLKPKVWK